MGFDKSDEAMNRLVWQPDMETSCGVVLVNFGSILLLQYPQGHWDFPKGHVEDTDSSRLYTASRELKEETGITDAQFIEDFEYRTSYNFKHKGKRIDIFLSEKFSLPSSIDLLSSSNSFSWVPTSTPTSSIVSLIAAIQKDLASSVRN